MSVSHILRRVRSAGVAGVLKRLAPRAVDQLLYMATGVPADDALPGAEPLAVRHATLARPSGVALLDHRLAAERECFFVLVDGEVAHQSWLLRDTVLPAQFGFDARNPVIGECETPERFRGQRLYPRVLQHILRGHFAREGAEPVYVLVAPTNTASVRAIERAGFTLAGRLRGMRVLGLVFRSRGD